MHHCPECGALCFCDLEDDDAIEYCDHACREDADEDDYPDYDEGGEA